jgi:tight adherence protein B
MRPSTDTEHAALLEAVARSMRGGGSLVQAIGEVCEGSPPGAAASDLAVALRSVHAGVPLADALSTWATAAGPGDDARRLAGAALTLGADLGGASARSLDAAAVGLRDRAALGREVRALTSQARASAVVMVSAPVAFLVLGTAADHRVSQALLTVPTGLVCLASGVVLDLIGAAWMARMTRRIT